MNISNFVETDLAVGLSVCLSLASDSSETVEVIIINPGTMTASDMRMHHVLIVLTLTFIQGHAELNQENSKCWIISETVQTVPINFAAKIVRRKVYIIFSQFDDLHLHSRSPLRLELDKCFTYAAIVIPRTKYLS